MNDSEMSARLVSCFHAVFPGLTTDRIIVADQDSLQAWDSVAGITLITVIEDEFGVKLDLERLGELTSFSAIISYLREGSGIK